MSDDSILTYNYMFLKTTVSWFYSPYRYLQDYEQVNEDGGVPDYLDRYGEELIESKLAENPVHALKLFKRLAIDWKLIESVVSSENWKGKYELKLFFTM